MDKTQIIATLILFGVCMMAFIIGRADAMIFGLPRITKKLQASIVASKFEEGDNTPEPTAPEPALPSDPGSVHSDNTVFVFELKEGTAVKFGTKE